MLKIAIVDTTSDGSRGGQERYLTNLAYGLAKTKLANVRLVLMTRGVGTREAWKDIGFPLMDIYSSSKVASAVEIMNTSDVVVFAEIHNYGDAGYAKKNPDKKPWFYDAVSKVTAPAVGFIHMTDSYKKFAPYIDVYESVCSAFVANKTTLSLAYAEDRGKVPCYSLPIPVDTDVPYDLKYHRHPIIASTARIAYNKRYQHIVKAMMTMYEYEQLYPYPWTLDVHAGTFDYHKLQGLKAMMGGKTYPNIIIDTSAKRLDLDRIYRHAALVYNSTKFETGNEGGMECVTLEGGWRGAVPLLSEEWVEPWPDSPPLDACYKFHIENEQGDSDLVKIIPEIDPLSKDYKMRQQNIVDHIYAYHSDRMIAHRFIAILEDCFGREYIYRKSK